MAMYKPVAPGPSAYTTAKVTPTQLSTLQAANNKTLSTQTKVSNYKDTKLLDIKEENIVVKATAHEM